MYLMREQGLAAAALEDIVDRRSGLLGLSGISSDLRRLHASSAPGARLALAMFQESVAKQIAGMGVALGGIDRLVFTGGIGENDGATRDGIVGRLAWLGRIAVQMLPSREDDEIARHTALLTMTTGAG